MLRVHLTMQMVCENSLSLNVHLVTCNTLDFHNSTCIQVHICLEHLTCPQRFNFLNWPLDEVVACLAVQCESPWYSLQE